jgi:hypothetical protein
MFELFKLFMSFSAAGTLILIVGALVGLSSIDDFGRKHEWWGVPVRLVMVDGVNFVDPGTRLAGLRKGRAAPYQPFLDDAPLVQTATLQAQGS